MRTLRSLGIVSLGGSLVIAILLVALLAASPAVAQEEPDGGPIAFSQEELDQLLAPIALYPDDLLSQVLMAATYPLEVVQAQRFVDATSGMQDSVREQAVAAQPWDDSVKSLVAFPSVLAMMNDQLDWTQKLGDAFLNQQAQVMDTVQALRARAQANGSLAPNDDLRIVADQGVIEIEAAEPDVFYVPFYDPTIVFGVWWWPDHRPWYWRPPVRFRPPHWREGGGIWFGTGIGIGHGHYFLPARPDWHDHHVTIDTRPRGGATGTRPPTTVWQHDPDHRHGVAYRDVPTRDKFLHVDPTDVRNRDPYRGRETPQNPTPVNPPRPPRPTRPETPPQPVRPPSPPSPIANPPKPVRPPAPPPPPIANPVQPHPQPPAVSRPAMHLPPPTPSRPDNALRPTQPRDEVKVQSDRGRQSREAASHPTPPVATARPSSPPPHPPAAPKPSKPPKPPVNASR